MKKFILATSVTLGIGFALALANAEDTTTSIKKETTKETTSVDSCTDDMGTTFKRGQVGYKDCAKMMSKHKGSGGQAGMSNPNQDQSMDNSMNDSSNTSDSSRDTSSSNSGGAYSNS